MPIGNRHKDPPHFPVALSGNVMAMPKQIPPEISEYESVAAEIGRLVTEKQRAYGDAFGRAPEVLKILYPNGIAPSQYDDVLTIVRILDKLFRIATDKTALGENPYRDIAGYALLAVVRDAQLKK